MQEWCVSSSQIRRVEKLRVGEVHFKMKNQHLFTSTLLLKALIFARFSSVQIHIGDRVDYRSSSVPKGNDDTGSLHGLSLKAVLFNRTNGYTDAVIKELEDAQISDLRRLEQLSFMDSGCSVEHNSSLSSCCFVLTLIAINFFWGILKPQYVQGMIDR